jgi:protein required for attachment to host cells
MARYVLVADGGQARVLRSSGRGGAVHLRETEKMERPSLHIAKRDMTSDITGRVFSFAARGRGGRGRPVATPHGAQSDFDPHAAEVARFAKTVSRKLDSLRRAGGVDEFVLLVEPRFLGLLRKEMTNVTRRLVTREIARDFVHADERRIERAAFAAER